MKDARPCRCRTLTADQLKKVREFKSRVGKRALYSTFATTDDLANKVRVYLTKFVLDWSKDGETNAQPKETSGFDEPVSCQSSNDAGDGDLDDEGLLDLQEEFEGEMNALTAVLKRMTSAVQDVGEDMAGRTHELQSLQVSGDDLEPSYAEQRRRRTAAQRVLKNSADDMNKFVARMKDELPLYRQHLDKGLSRLMKAIPIYLEIYDDEGTTELKENIKRMLDATDGTLGSMEGFHGTVRQLPRMTKHLVRSKRETEKVLQEVIDISRDGKASLEAALALLS